MVAQRGKPGRAAAFHGGGKLAQQLGGHGAGAAVAGKRGGAAPGGGRWSGAGVLLACLFFGFCDALQIRLQVGSFGVPYQFFQMIPYIATVVVLAGIGMKKAGPKSSGKPYLKEER